MKMGKIKYTFWYLATLTCCHIGMHYGRNFQNLSNSSFLIKIIEIWINMQIFDTKFWKILMYLNYTCKYCFHPILVNWFLVVFGDEVTKILSCPFCLANLKHRTENHTTKVTKKPKTKLPKYVMSRAKETKSGNSYHS